MAMPISEKERNIAGLRPTRSPQRPIKNGAERPREKPDAEDEQRQQEPRVAVLMRKEGVADLDGEEAVGEEVVEFERVAGDDGRDLPDRQGPRRAVRTIERRVDHPPQPPKRVISASRSGRTRSSSGCALMPI